MKNLDSLILAHNQLTKVPANVFRHLTLLNSLELEGNQISYVDKDAFAGLEGMRRVFWLQIICRDFLLISFDSFQKTFNICAWVIIIYIKFQVTHYDLYIVCAIWICDRTI